MVEVSHGPLAGVRIVELDVAGPVSLACMLLADMGCDVVRIRRPAPDPSGIGPILYRGRTDVSLDIASVADREQVLTLISAADAVVEGYRVGVAEQIALDPGRCLSVNPRLVYARTSGWGREGPLARTPGTDINHLALSGALHAIGPAATPMAPLNLAGEYGGGALYLALGVVAGILAAQATGRGQVVEAAQIDGVASMMTLYYALHGAGRWADARSSNLVDGGAPFYRCYACSDGRHMAVGAIDPIAFAALLEVLGIPQARFEQFDRAHWPELSAALAEAFATRSRDEWDALFAETDACVTPVLSLAEAPLHVHNRSRNLFEAVDSATYPAPAPRFSHTPGRAVPGEEASVEQVLARWI